MQFILSKADGEITEYLPNLTKVIETSTYLNGNQYTTTLNVIDIEWKDIEQLYKQFGALVIDKYAPFISEGEVTTYSPLINKPEHQIIIYNFYLE